jgi:phosphocarrier protein
MMENGVEPGMDDKQVSVLMTHEVGLHARPSVKLTKLAKSFNSAIQLALAPTGPWIDAKSIVKVMAMKARKDSMLHFRASGTDANAALAAIVALVESDFDDGHAEFVDR